jgi:hypothetical protein
MTGGQKLAPTLPNTAPVAKPVGAFTVHLPARDATAYPGDPSQSAVATGMARGETTTRAGALTSSSRSPSPPQITGANGKVSLRPIKEFVRSLRPDHPLRTVLMGEPDHIDSSEYLVKLTVWLRLLPNDGH